MMSRSKERNYRLSVAPSQRQLLKGTLHPRSQPHFRLAFVLIAFLQISWRRCQAFTGRSLAVPKVAVYPKEFSQSFTRRSCTGHSLNCQKSLSNTDGHRSSFFRRLQQIFGRFDTIQSSRLYEETEYPVLNAGVGDLFRSIKKLHDPIVYFVMGILLGFRYDWCFKSPVYWFAIGFTIKWYRARYVFKIPVWDRQPNWNNIITSKEQEKDLKAYTCKNCGSTIFIAKTREFFFEGSTGFGGLGCFSCGAKGKDNFIMDRDRIVEDVGEMDDYFEYERPLDFVSRAERRKLLKEAQGDEDRANQLLLERTTGMSSTSLPTDTIVESTDSVRVEVEEPVAPPALIEDTHTLSLSGESENGDTTLDLQSKWTDAASSVDEVTSESNVDLDDKAQRKDEPELVPDEMADHASSVLNVQAGTDQVSEVLKPQKMETFPVNSPSKPKSGVISGLDGLDELDMDAW